jgi:hypothetical protein
LGESCLAQNETHRGRLLAVVGSVAVLPPGPRGHLQRSGAPITGQALEHMSVAALTDAPLPTEPTGRTTRKPLSPPSLAFQFFWSSSSLNRPLGPTPARPLGHPSPRVDSSMAIPAPTSGLQLKGGRTRAGDAPTLNTGAHGWRQLPRALAAWGARDQQGWSLLGIAQATRRRPEAAPGLGRA